MLGRQDRTHVSTWSTLRIGTSRRKLRVALLVVEALNLPKCAIDIDRLGQAKSVDFVLQLLQLVLDERFQLHHTGAGEHRVQKASSFLVLASVHFGEHRWLVGQET